MSVLVTDSELAARRSVAEGPLRPLADSLAADLDVVRDGDIFIPPEKAVLSREGGRCPRDGVLLEFDPASPRAHRCPACGEVYTGELHYRFWIYWYQLWLAERVVHGAVLHALGRGDKYGAFSRTVVERYAASYVNYPNVDNVLGPTRLFFSTYLESIWLLQIVVAADLLERAGDWQLAGTVRDRIVQPSRELIAGYNEGLSNRQVWNNAALFAAARFLGDNDAIDAIVYGDSGLASHLGQGLLVDGTWYEGENYHQFAHRGLWYGVTIAERAGLELDPPLVERFREGFVAPFATALPDFTLPSRRDSQYAISLRQWRIAEHCELGLARQPDPRLRGALRRLYDDSVPRSDTGRARSSADVERNMPPTKLSRADLGWRALLHALPELPPSDGEASEPESVLLEGQGIAVFRREHGEVYAALDYGHHGGGHGHPDRLNLLLVRGDTRWLDDFGTGSYVDPSLHWYRSTLAHNAPLVNGSSQAKVHGTLLAYDERENAGWIMASAEEIAPGVSAARTLVVMDGYLIDELEWRADHRVKVDVPIHIDARIVRGASDPRPDRLSGGAAFEDGFAFLGDMTLQRADAGSLVELEAKDSMRVWWASSEKAEWWRATAPGPPGTGDHSFRIVRCVAPTGRHRSVWSWAGRVSEVVAADRLTVRLDDGTVHVHERTPTGWQVAVRKADEQSLIAFGNLLDVEEPIEITTEEVFTITARKLFVGTVLDFDLREASYRRSEQSWEEAGEPTAVATLEWTGRTLRLTIDVPRSDCTFVAADAVNPYDNEPPDINGDGVQLYLATASGRMGVTLVPEPQSNTVRVRSIEGWTGALSMTSRWERRGAGYRLHVDAAFDAPSDGEGSSFVALDVIVNEKPRGRERRRGQLVLSGGKGEFVYLRGDRHEQSRLIPFLLANA